MKGLIIVILIVWCSVGKTQNSYWSLRGTVYDDETKEPIQQRGLNLYSIDSVLVKSIGSNEKGKFNAIGIKKGKYYLKTGRNGNGGYKLWYSEVIEIPKQSKVDVYLKPNPITLSKDSNPPTFLIMDTIIMYNN